MRLRGGEGFLAPAVLLIGEKGGMNFAPALQPHKKTVSALRRLVYPANARGEGRAVHDASLDNGLIQSSVNNFCALG